MKIQGIEISEANEAEIPQLINKLEAYIKEAEDEFVIIVGKRLLNELKTIQSFPDMFVLIATDQNSDICISNGVLATNCGLSYHTISLSKTKGIGSSLFEEKMLHMFNNRKKVLVAKPESVVGLKLAQRLGFKPAKIMKDRLSNWNQIIEESKNLDWEGEEYILTPDLYKPLN